MESLDGKPPQWKVSKESVGVTKSVGLLGIVVSVFQYLIENLMHRVGYIIGKRMGDINNHDYS